MGAIGTRLSLRPLIKKGRNEEQASGETSRENANVCQSSLRAKRSNPLARTRGAMYCFVAFAPRNDDVAGSAPNR
jgi:hypothetical protein